MNVKTKRMRKQKTAAGFLIGACRGHCLYLRTRIPQRREQGQKREQMGRRPQPVTAFNSRAPMTETLNQDMTREKLLARSLSFRS